MYLIKTSHYGYDYLMQNSHTPYFFSTEKECIDYINSDYYTPKDCRCVPATQCFDEAEIPKQPNAAFKNGMFIDYWRQSEGMKYREQWCGNTDFYAIEFIELDLCMESGENP